MIKDESIEQSSGTDWEELIDWDKVENFSQKTKLVGELDKFNHTLCPVCGNVNQKPNDKLVGIHVDNELDCISKVLKGE